MASASSPSVRRRLPFHSPSLPSSVPPHSSRTVLSPPPACHSPSVRTAGGWWWWLVGFRSGVPGAHDLPHRAAHRAAPGHPPRLRDAPAVPPTPRIPPPIFIITIIVIIYYSISPHEGGGSSYVPLLTTVICSYAPPLAGSWPSSTSAAPLSPTHPPHPRRVLPHR